LYPELSESPRQQLAGISIDQAEKVSSFGGSYWQYPIFVNGQRMSCHRYSDFVCLRGRLVTAFPGCCTPTLPDKQGLSSYWRAYSEDYLRYRRHSLEQFLQFCTRHPVLVDSEDLTCFIQDEQKFARITKESQGGGRYLNYLSELSTTIVSSVTKYVYGSSSGIALSAEDHDINEQMQEWSVLKTRNEVICEEAGSLVTKLEAEADSNFALSKAYENLAQVESESLRKNLDAFGKGHLMISELLKQAKVEIRKLFGERLEDSLHITRGVIEAFDRRREIVERLLQDKMAIGKQGFAEAEVVRRRLEVYEKMLQKVSDQLTADLTDLYGLRSKVLEEVAAQYVAVQISLAEKTEEVWREVHNEVCS
jgi:hypothetical protein